MTKLKLPDSNMNLVQEEVKSEYLRSLLLVILFSVMFVIAIFNYLILERDFVNYYGGFKTFIKILTFIGVFIGYQLLIIAFLKRRLVDGLRTPVWFKIGHTIIEISFPSLVILIMMNGLNMLSFIDTPVMVTYFLFIILSILHLDYRVNIFAGVFAAVEYAALTYYGFKYIDASAEFKALIPANSHYIRCVILILSGGAAAFVSAELKSRILTALDFREAKDKIQLLFGQQVSREVSQTLIEQKGDINRGEATVMFLDIRNFTAFADTHEAEEVIDYQNKFLGPVIDIINLHQGVVYQILGDGLMACFGAPVQNTLHADMAFQASLSILDHVDQASRQRLIPVTRIGIGLHSGSVITGNIGNERRKQFSISGAPVIVASRIEQLNKKYSTSFLISGEVFERIIPGKTMITALGMESLKGIEKPVAVYKVDVDATDQGSVIVRAVKEL